MEKKLNESGESLKRLRRDIPRVINTLQLGTSVDITSWTNIIDGKLLPRFSPDFPIMAAICGGGSSGKSALFNSLVGDRLSPSGGKAGINRRILVSAPGELFRQSNFLSTLFEPFGAVSKPLQDKNELTVPGCPLYILNSNVPRNMVLVDTPDFDTGARGDYTNRDIVQQALETSDILIYIFTNSNYNNRDNTDFISKMLTGIGIRKCFLIYRVYSSFETHEVISHAMVVARNLYGDNADKYLLGIYRADEDNEVAAGRKFMDVRPVRENDPPFTEALKKLDPRTLRPELLVSISDSVLKKAEEIIVHAKISLEELRLYLNALQSVQSICVKDALLHFPIDIAMKRFAEIWLSKDPPYIKTMRKTGDIVGMPVKALSDALKWVKNKVTGNKTKGNSEFKDKVEDDLLNAVNNIRQKTVSSEISVSLAVEDPVAIEMLKTVERMKVYNLDFSSQSSARAELSDEKGTFTFWVNVHPVVLPEQEKLRNKDWRSALEAILSHKDMIIRLSDNIEKEMDDLAEHFRSKIGFSDRIRQTFSAFLNVLPATAAITYVLSTGDPVGAVGIKIKLASLFGLHDLYALIAIPATSGIKKADQQQIEAMLAPIAQSWLNDKLKVVQELFEQEVTGKIICLSGDTIKESEELIKAIEENIERCRKANGIRK